MITCNSKILFCLFFIESLMTGISAQQFKYPFQNPKLSMH